jgi:hypothetical protein
MKLWFLQTSEEKKVQLIYVQILLQVKLETSLSEE